MQQASNWINYEERLNRVTAYIYEHLDDELDLLRLAEVTFLSPYHFHRIYRAARGETIATTVRRLRLHRAAGYLARTTIAIADISQASGYKNIQSFTHTFNAVYGSHTQYQSTNLERSLAMYNITLKTLPDLEVVSLAHSGSYLHISQAFDRLGSWLVARNLIGADTRMMGVYYDDPDIVAEKDLRSRACMTVSKPCVLEAPLERITIAGGEYAVLRHKGSYDGLAAAYKWFFGVWLLQSGRELRDVPAFEEYLNTPLDTAPAELLTEIHLPLV
jgi:AraC family transcriptional regulator